jgi:type IV pilus assembly protein PilM
MDVKNLFKKGYIVGIDIGSNSVKMVQLAVNEGALLLVKAELKEIGMTKDAEEREKEVVSALRYVVRGIDLKKSSVIVNVNCSNTSIKKVTIPYMPRSELREGIMIEAKTYFPFQIDQAVLDFEVIGDVVDKGVRKYEVMVGACPLDTVNKYLTILQKAGIKPASFVSTSYSLQKFAENISRTPSGVQCYVDIGEIHTELIICKDCLLVFSRKIPLCGNDFTKAMTGVVVSDKGKHQLSVEEAEKIKCDVGMPNESDSRIIDNKILAGHILSMLRTPAEQLVNEIDRCFNYYRDDPASLKINSVTMFGGGASLSGLIKFLSQGLGMDVKLGDALEVFKTDKGAIRDREKISHRMDLAVGAALTEAKGLNLLPPEIKEATQKIIKRGSVEAIVTAAVIISILLFVGMKIKINNFNKRISVARLQLSSLQPELKKAEGMRLAEMVLKDEPYWEDVFNELGSLIPNEVTIKNIKMNNNHLNIKGIVSSADGQQMLTGLVITLEKGLFNDVKLIESRNLPDRSGVEFEITCWIDYEH